MKTMHHWIAFLLMLWFPLCVRAGASPNRWVFGDTQTTCTATCTNAGGVCSATNTNAVDTQEKMQYVAETKLGLTCNGYISSTDPYAPWKRNSDNKCYYRGSAPTTCDSIVFGRRICCCSSNAADCPTSA